MELRRTIKSYQAHPISHQVLLHLLKDCKRPNDKNHELLKEGDLISLKKAYICGRVRNKFTGAFHNCKCPLRFQLCVGRISFLVHGLIPEQVFTVTSMTLKPTKTFTNELGDFANKKNINSLLFIQCGLS